MATYKKRNNRKFDIDARGIRSSWAKIGRLYDNQGALPNDSEIFGRQILDYVAMLTNEYNNSTASGIRRLDESTYRTGDGYGGNGWDLTEEYNPAVVAAYDQLAQYLRGAIGDEFFDTNGGLRPARFKTEYNVVVTDSDGVMTTKNAYVFLKQFMPDWMDFDFFARKKVASSVAVATVEDSDIATSLTGSVKKVLSTSVEPMVVRGDLTVDGSTTLNGNLILGDAAADSLVVNATTDFTNGVDLKGNTTIGDANTDTLTVNADASFTDDLTVTGLTTLNGGLVMDGTAFTVANGSGNVHTNGTLDVDGAANFDSTMQIDGATNIDGALTATSTLTVTGLTTLNGGLVMDGSAFTVANGSGNVHTNGTLDVDGAANFDSTMQIDGATNIDGALTATSTLTVTGLTTLNGGLVMDGSAFTVANGSGNVHTNGTLDVDGAANFDSTMQIDGATNLSNNLTVAGVTTLNGNTTIGNAASDTLTITSATTVATVGANQIVFGDTAGELDGNSNLTWNGSTMNVTGAVTVSGMTTLNGGLTMDGSAFTVANTSGNVHTNGSLDVDGAVNFDSTLRVDGNVDFNSKAGITASSGAVQTDSLAGTGQRFVTVNAAGTLGLANPTAQVGLIIYDSGGGVLKTIYAPSA